MNKKLYWGLGVLFILIIGGFVFLLIQQKAELNQWEADAAKDKKLPAAARPGNKLVKHGDHVHEVPIDAPDTWQEEPAPVAKDVPVYQPPVTKTYDGPLTFHAELLKTNPVKALRLQAEERGHWSAEWIPSFPPDDEEAQAYARNQYLRQYYESIGDMDNPANIKAQEECLSMLDTFMTYPFGARRYDLMKLTWPNLRAGSALHTDSTPSDYFPNYHTEKGIELLKPYYPNLFDSSTRSSK